MDGSSYLFRAFYALPPLTTKTGHPTGAMLGVLNMLDRLLQEYDPEYIGVIFDAKGKTFRHHLYEAYKAHRRAMPEDLKQQVEPLHELVKALGLPLVMIEGVEADDVIGTLALAASREGQTVLISTGDKDIAQLVNPRVSLIDTMKGAYSDEAGVKAKFGVRPDQIIDYLALVGDASDNIPGVSKVGPKTALKWLEEYGSLDNLLAHADEISGKVGENLRADRETALLSRQLVTIQCDVPLPVTWQSLIRRPVDPSVLLPLLKAWEFKSWIKKYETTPEEEVSSPLSTLPAQYECITNEADWAKWKQKLETAPLISIDTETTSLDEMQAKLVGISFTTGDQTSAYLPLGHDLLSAPEQLPFEKTLSDIKPILTRHDLDALSERHLGRKTITYESVAGKGAKAITFDQVPLSAAAPYAAEDADLAWQLYLFFQNKFREIPSLETVFQEVEIPMIDVLVAMERRGVLVNQSLLQAQSQEIAHELLKLEEKIYHEAGMSFNVASPKQLQEVLFEKMQIPVTRKTPGGQPSTAEDVLQELAEQYVLPALILEYRHLNKLKSTYTDRLPEQINPDTGRVHTHYQQAVAATGRLASSDPNLQNIPIRTEQGRRIRQAFIAPKGYRILAADYSQVELRIMARLMMSAAVPCIGALMAARSAARRRITSLER
ncbi:MAG: DNA polymerase I, partial [Gammaproteobacteria bacterium]|nr:DNA polymerase I [Gammaproteobacteria bacterium]